MAEPIPYPGEGSAPVTNVVPSKTQPFFGHKAGNYMPDSGPSDKVHANTTEEYVKRGKALLARVTGEWVSNGAVARWDNSNIQDGIGSGSDSYRMYWGAGRANEGWPTRSQWVSFQNMFDNNKGLMQSSCSWMGVPNDSGPEIVRPVLRLIIRRKSFVNTAVTRAPSGTLSNRLPARLA